jgi:hypothetical protein
MRNINYILTFFLSIIFFVQKAGAQTYCGLTYYYDAGGNRVQRIVTADCTGGEGRMMVVTDTTTNDTTGQKLTEALYPNPTNGLFAVVFNNPVSEAQLSIMDNLGRQLYGTTISGTTIPIDITRFSDGIYMVVVRTGGNKYQSTVVKN